MNRKRKTQDPCSGCNLHKERCICDQIPRMALKTKISLVIHYKELQRSTNTGKLALKALSNSEIYSRGDKNSSLDLSNLIMPEYENFILYPSECAQDLDAKWVSTIKKPFHLIVPDGTWRQASKVHYRHPEIKLVPRIKVNTNHFSNPNLRKSPSENKMATIVALANALEIIEGKTIQEELLKIFLLKINQTLSARGIKIEN